jgi:pimeloyl-ACP methyl ester carboxylesterase
MPFAAVNGQRIAYDDSGGRGPAVVLGHGFLMDRSMFGHQVEALARDYRIVTWDARGFGDTVWDERPFTYWDLADDCIALLDHLELERPVIGGMSQGGYVSLRAALRHPDRVRALVLLSTGAELEDAAVIEGYRAMVDVWTTAGPVDDLANTVAAIIINEPDENQRWIAKWRATRYELLREPAECLFGRDDISDRLGEITCPVLVVHGTADTAIAPDVAERLAKGLAAATGPVFVDGAAHAANLTHPQPVNAAIRSFLAALPG